MRLRINGDDFGMDRSCSAAIIRALGDGLITHTSMMANGAFFDEALHMAQEHSVTDRIGIHFNLTEGEPLSRGIRAVSAFVKGGRFHKQYLSDPRPLTDGEEQAVYEELCAQARRLRDAGIGIAHADSHHYVHNISNLAPVFARVCQEYGIRRIRLNRTFDTPERPRVTAHRISNIWWREQGFVTTAHFGRMSDIRDGIVPDDTEIMTHPDLDRSGRLIDRIGYEDGAPVGRVLVRLPR